jgi:hypothetical protein
MYLRFPHAKRDTYFADELHRLAPVDRVPGRYNYFYLLPFIWLGMREIAENKSYQKFLMLIVLVL